MSFGQDSVRAPGVAGRGRRQWLRRGSWLVVGVFMTMTASAAPAWAHGAGETTEGYVLIQQALANLAYSSGHTGLLLAMEKVDDALRTKDQDGVDVAQLKQAEAALQADRVGPARALLQQSITVAVSRLVPATGEQTGTNLVLTPMRGRGGLTGQDWGFGVASLLMVLAGTALALRFRPADNLKQLRRRLTVPAMSVPASLNDESTQGHRS